MASSSTIFASRYDCCIVPFGPAVYGPPDKFAASARWGAGPAAIDATALLKENIIVSARRQ